MWEEAFRAHPGHETKTWCASTTTGVCIPVLKNKGDRTDRNNYRNLVMLSAAAKLIAKVIAMRLSSWAEGFLDEEQNGFRKNRGIDDAHQVARRIIEEVVVAQHDKAVAITSFDIIRAYTRVCRQALWELVDRLGLPTSFVQVVKALHEHTTFTVFIHNGYSSPWLTERGLREGCPSSPVLFNIFHSYILKTFRHRRALQAHNLNITPGLPWCFKVDGHLTRTVAGKQSSRGVLKVCLGDVEYADETQIMGYEEEVALSETLFQNTLKDWAQQEHLHKREKIILCSGGRCRMDVTREFEQKTMKHLGAFLKWPDTKKRVQAGFLAVKRIAKLWSLGSPHGRGRQTGLSTSRKLKVMSLRSVVEGTLLACGKTRVWSKAQEKRHSRYCLVQSEGAKVWRAFADWCTGIPLNTYSIDKWCDGLAMWPVCLSPASLRLPYSDGRNTCPHTKQVDTPSRCGSSGCLTSTRYPS